MMEEFFAVQGQSNFIFQYPHKLYTPLFCFFTNIHSFVLPRIHHKKEKPKNIKTTHKIIDCYTFLNTSTNIKRVMINIRE